jgi:predicted ferric reductase
MPVPSLRTGAPRLGSFQGARGGRDRWRAAVDWVLVLAVGLGAAVLAGSVLRDFAVDQAAPLFWSGPAAIAASAGRLVGLLAGLLILAMILLVARLPSLERVVGRDRLLRWHTGIAMTLPVLVLAHVTLTVTGGSAQARQPVLDFYATLVSSSVSIIPATAAFGLLLAIGSSSARWIRRRLRYETWQAIHLCGYAALLAAVFHQVLLGTEFLRHPALRLAWITVAVTLLAAAVWCRFVAPVIASLAGNVRVHHLVRESANAWSLYLSGTRLSARIGEAGTFCYLRVLTRGRWAQAHPFSVSGLDAGLVRFTFSATGDFTTSLAGIAPGTRVVVEGPYGRFRASRARSQGPFLLIGVGSGMGAVVGVLSNLPTAATPVVIQRARSRETLLFADELGGLADTDGIAYREVLGPRQAPTPAWHSIDALHALVPDLARREAFLCGPATLCRQLVRLLRAAGVPASRIHAERFAFGGDRVAAPAASRARPVRRPP